MMGGGFVEGPTPYMKATSIPLREQTPDHGVTRMLAISWLLAHVSTTLTVRCVCLATSSFCTHHWFLVCNRMMCGMRPRGGA